MRRSQKLLRLLCDFAKMGCCTFGGGWSLIAQMQRLFVEQRKNITSEELLDLTSVAKSLPGVMIGHTAVLYGYREAGAAGALAALLGMTTPPFLILSVITFFYKAFRSSYWVSAFMRGLQAAVVPIILSAVLALAKGSLKYRGCLAVLIGCFLCYELGVNLYILVFAGGAAGLLISEHAARKEP